MHTSNTLYNVVDNDSQEEWRIPIRHGTELPGYLVSNLGNVLGKRGQRMTGYFDDRPSMGYQKYSLTISTKIFDGYVYASNSINTSRLSIDGHRLVIETFKPLDDYPPIPKEDWDACPESAKNFIKEAAIVDHIDKNKINNCASNLRWVTPKQNNSHRKDTEQGLKKPIIKSDLFGIKDNK